MNHIQFHNTLRKLLNIEGGQLTWMTDIQRDNFYSNPHMFFVRCDDETAARLWEVMYPRAPAPVPAAVVVPFARPA